MQRLLGKFFINIEKANLTTVAGRYLNDTNTHGARADDPYGFYFIFHY